MFMFDTAVYSACSTSRALYTLRCIPVIIAHLESRCLRVQRVFAGAKARWHIAVEACCQRSWSPNSRSLSPAPEPPAGHEPCARWYFSRQQRANFCLRGIVADVTVACRVIIVRNVYSAIMERLGRAQCFQALPIHLHQDSTRLCGAFPVAAKYQLLFFVFFFFFC